LPPLTTSQPRRRGWEQRTIYRARQFFLGFRSSLSIDEAEEARALLAEPELLLFTEMEARDRRHSFDMAHWLRERMPPPGPEPALLRAVLLHDVGKGRLQVVERVLFVLLGAVSPRLRDALSRQHGPHPLPALWRLRQHAALGAERLAAVGTDARVRTLVARHTESLHARTPGMGPGDEVLERELAWLMAADEAC